MVSRDEIAYKTAIYRYASGFITALVLVYLVYFATTEQWFSRTGLGIFILALAVIQLVVQLMVFLHIGQKGARLTMWSIIYGFVMTLIIVGGSLWVMANMNYNMHITPGQMNDYMVEQNKKGF